MNSEDFIKVAGQIAGFGGAGSRSATSRAYYGAFHFAIDILCEITSIRERAAFPRKHEAPRRCLGKSSHPDAREAENLLGNLQTRRIKSDYKLDDSSADPEAFGRYSVIQAEECKGHLEAFRTACLSDATLKDDFVESTNLVFKLSGY